MIVLGIGGLLGDTAAAVLKDNELVAAVEESKLVRNRPHWRDAGIMPERALATCLDLAGVKAADVDVVAVARPIPRSDALLPAASRGVSEQPDRGDRSSGGACGVGVLLLAVR